MGKCTACGELNTVTELALAGGKSSQALRVRDLSPGASLSRDSLEIDYLDRVLGGGLPPGTVVLLAGEPGIGKSTLLFQMVLKQRARTLYVSAEESVDQHDGLAV